MGSLRRLCRASPRLKCAACGVLSKCDVRVRKVSFYRLFDDLLTRTRHTLESCRRGTFPGQALGDTTKASTAVTARASLARSVSASRTEGGHRARCGVRCDFAAVLRPQRRLRSPLRSADEVAAVLTKLGLTQKLYQQRLRPERRAKSRRESERGWGPASIK